MDGADQRGRAERAGFGDRLVHLHLSINTNPTPLGFKNRQKEAAYETKLCVIKSTGGILPRRRHDSSDIETGSVFVESVFSAEKLVAALITRLMLVLQHASTVYSSNAENSRRGECPDRSVEKHGHRCDPV